VAVVLLSGLFPNSPHQYQDPPVFHLHLRLPRLTIQTPIPAVSGDFFPFFYPIRVIQFIFRQNEHFR
jgi:hypothetical protein